MSTTLVHEGEHSPSGATARGTAERGEAVSPSKGDIAQYLATLILGAGLFLLPLEAAHVGMVPVLLMLAVILWPCIKLYERVAALMVRRDHGSAGGGEALGRAVVEAGGGAAGTVLALIGITVYVTGAAIVYNRLGVPGLETLAALAADERAMGVGMAVALVGCIALMRTVPRRMVVARRLLWVTIVWGAGVAVIAVLGGDPIVTQGIALAVFAIGCVVVNRTAGPAEIAEQEPGSLTADHKSSIVGLRLQFVLMIVMALIAVAIVVMSSRLRLRWDAVWVADDFKLSHLLGPAAVVLFAHVGTGMSNVANYSAMGSSKFRRSVVRRSLWLVTAVLVAWLAPMVLLFGHEGLAQLVEDKTNSAMGITPLLASEAAAWANVLAILGSLATLIAVTNANAGFITSLSREIIGATVELRPQARRLPSEDRLTLALVVLLTLAAGGAIASGDTLSPMLHIAGITGGGVLVFTLPLLAEDRERAHRVRYGFGAALVTVGLGLWGTATTLAQDNIGAAVTVAMIAVAWAPLVPTMLAARGVIRGHRDDEPPAVAAAVPLRPLGPPATAQAVAMSPGVTATAADARRVLTASVIHEGKA